MNVTVFRAGFVCAIAGFLLGCDSPPQGAARETIELFNGRDLAGWKHVLADPNVLPDEVWTVRDGVIVCQGNPIGFLHSDRAFLDFRLTLDYRWAPGSKPGNSGVFSRVNGPLRALPRCAEVQLMHGNAGDVITLQGMRLATNQPRYFHVAKHELAGDIDGVRKLRDCERAPGRWNRVEIVAQGSLYTVRVNGRLVNEAMGVEAITGPIGLQSEGGEIHFRRVQLTVLP
jgi:hypothetical protein